MSIQLYLFQKTNQYLTNMNNVYLKGKIAAVNVIREMRDLTRPSLKMRHQVAKNNIGVHATLRFTLLCARIMGFLPVTGLTGTTGRDVRYI